MRALALDLMTLAERLISRCSGDDWPSCVRRRILLNMRREISRGGAWLLGAGITGFFAYLTVTATQAGRHPNWLYFVFSAVAASGAALYIVGRRSDRAEKTRKPFAVKVPPPQPSLSQPHPLSQTPSSPWNQNRSPEGYIKIFRFQRKVQYWESIKGNVSGPTRDAEPCLLVHSILNGEFIAYKLGIDYKGNFEVRVSFHGSPGEEYILLLVFAPRYTNFNNFVDRLPEDVRILDQRRVLRK